MSEMTEVRILQDKNDICKLLQNFSLKSSALQARVTMPLALFHSTDNFLPIHSTK